MAEHLLLPDHLLREQAAEGVAMKVHLTLVLAARVEVVRAVKRQIIRPDSLVLLATQTPVAVEAVAEETLPQ
jgi:hypothetical protein